MKPTKSIVFGIAVSVLATAAAAGETKIYTYSSKENFCPAGLQPVSINGVICCGTPTTDQSYQSVMAHPVPKKAHKASHIRAADTCPEGQKGCY